MWLFHIFSSQIYEIIKLNTIGNISNQSQTLKYRSDSQNSYGKCTVIAH